MRVLLDEQLPRRLAAHFSGHEVSTVQRQGWAGMKNGELLERAAEHGFEVLVTKDQGIEFEQNLTGSSLRIVLLVAPTNAIEDLVPLVPAALEAIEAVRAGEVRHVSA